MLLLGFVDIVVVCGHSLQTLDPWAARWATLASGPNVCNVQDAGAVGDNNTDDGAVIKVC